ncbi:hypothetical protein B0H16DRAFT_1484130 [Mycena metata]|uniref:Uncharacterized protein n=1 Tax=Mycena metata TaxID=1033252 RepID=A0AAD7GL16_9AGAR|nr:hypothetical protein B0H16DRAFT_1484130 [Mycena metata]
MPTPMVKHLVSLNVNAEGSTIGEILWNAVNFEMQRSINARYAEVREREKGSIPSKASASGTPSGSRVREESSIRGVKRDELKRKVFWFVKREGSSKDTAGKPREEMHAILQARPTGRDGGGNPAGRKPIACYKCGEPHYKKDKPTKSGKLEATSEHLRNAQVEEDNVCTSEGGYTVQEYSKYDLRSESEDAGENEDSETEVWTCSAKAKMRCLRAREYANWHAGLFRVCDDWDLVELLDDWALNKLAKEMADHVIWQGNTMRSKKAEKEPKRLQDRKTTKLEVDSTRSPV